jgi:galactokinase
MTGSIRELTNRISGDEGTELLSELYGEDDVDVHRSRWLRALKRFGEHYPERGGSDRDPLVLFSAPGRTELAGNHTDHNGGVVLAASVHLDTIAVVARQEERVVHLHSEGFTDPFQVDLRDLSPRNEEHHSPAALLRGVAAALGTEGYRVGGFSAYVGSAVPVGSGLSSSASFEILAAIIQSRLWNDGGIDTLTMARAGRLAENRFFGKPCGLMDQIACAHGGAVRIDFADENVPGLEAVDFEPLRHGYLLSVVNTGGSHADLTEDYAAVPAEMRRVAEALGAERLRDTREHDILERVSQLRSQLGDRALLRALHFHRENDRVDRIVRAVRHGAMTAALREIRESADSSWRLLQNYVPSVTHREQAIALVAALVEMEFPNAVARVHGGGFAGAVQVYIPVSEAGAFTARMSEIFGENAVVPLRIRPRGAGQLQSSEG